MKCIHRKNYREKLPPNTKLVARLSRWGNPWTLATKYPKDNAMLVDLFRAYLESQPQLVEAARHELTGYDFAGYCPPDKPCPNPPTVTHKAGHIHE